VKEVVITATEMEVMRMPPSIETSSKAVETNHDSHHFFLSKKNGWKLEAEKWRSCFWGLSSGLSFFVSHRYPSTGANFFGKKEKWLSITWLLFSSQNEC